MKPLSAIPSVPAFAPGADTLGLAAACARGEFQLQHCEACGHAQYPPRAACQRCLATSLRWRPARAAGRLLSASWLHHSQDPHYRARLPWRIGLVALDDGPVMLAHVQADIEAGAAVRLHPGLDRAGHPALVATQAGGAGAREGKLALFGNAVGGRRIALFSADAARREALLAALTQAGAAAVACLAPAAVDTRAMAEADIVIHDALPTDDTEGNGDAYPALRAHLQALLPAWRQRGGEPPLAWLGLFSLDALLAAPGWPLRAADQAACRALCQALRPRLAAQGIRVAELIATPAGAEACWESPATQPAALAGAAIALLTAGLESAAADAGAQRWLQRWLADPALAQRQCGQQEDFPPDWPEPRAAR